MRVLLVGPNLEENLSIRYLASSLSEAGHEADVRAFNLPSDLGRVARAARRADVVGLSLTFQARAREFLALARAIKADRPDLPVVAGGHYASCAAHEILEHHREIDLIAVHEAERTLPEIVDTLASGGDLSRVRGIVLRRGDEIRSTEVRPIEKDLDTLPWPDRRGPVYLHAGVPAAYLMGSRGCVGNCAYCCISTLHRLAPGPRFRQRRVENVAAEMASLYHERGIRQYIFHDDNFLVPSRAKNLARIGDLERALGERDVRDIGLTIKCRPQDADRAVFEKLRSMGLLRVFLGVETGCDETLAYFARRQSVADAERALALCDDLGISVQYTIMTFNPRATLETVREDIAFMRAHVHNPLNFCRTEIYAGTPLERRMREEGRARGGYLARTYGLLDPAADLACDNTLRIFRDRCWAPGSLMEFTIGSEYLMSVLGRFCEGRDVDDLRRDFGSWLERANGSTLDLLESVLDACEAHPDAADPALAPLLAHIEQEELATRSLFMREGRLLRDRLDALAYARVGLAKKQGRLWKLNLDPKQTASHAAAVLLALGLAGLGACGGPGCKPGVGVCEYAPPPLEDTDGDGLADECEATLFSTDPASTDTDGDGVPDGDEDHDGDGVTNLQEQEYNGAWSCDDVPPEVFDKTGVREMAPVPLDASTDAEDEASVPIIDDIGVCEEAAVPMQEDEPTLDEHGVIDEHGVKEYAAPPLKIEDDDDGD